MGISIEFELLSETIFGNGQSLPSSIDIGVLHDEFGLPYFKGKTFKGKLRVEVNEIALIAEEINPKIKLSPFVDRMFGVPGSSYLDTFNTLKFSNCMLDEKIRQAIIYGINKEIFTPAQVLNSLTSIRSFTSIDSDGIAEDKSLRQARVIDKGLKFETEIGTNREIEDIEFGLLAAGVRSLKHLGTMESRGKGEISAKLKIDGQNVTDKYIDIFAKEVNNN